MTVVVNTEARFTRGPDGVIRSRAANAAYESWTPYLAIDDDVRVMARVGSSHLSDGHLVEGLGISVVPIPEYTGLMGTLLSPLRTYCAIRAALKIENGIYCVRLPSVVGGVAVAGLKLRGAPYAVEVIGDPYDVMRSGIVPKYLGILGSYLFLWLTRWQCRGATVANYVTGRALQSRYPARNARYVSAISDVQLSPGAVVASPRALRVDGRATLVMVGTMSQAYKGHYVAIEALRLLHLRGYSATLVLVGEGRLEQDIRRTVEECGLGDSVAFLGQLGSDEVRRALDAADLFLLPSLTEGMPRALIEAMARGLPCVASNVGGVPELLDAPQLVPAGNAPKLAEAVRGLLMDEVAYTEASDRNLRRARDFERTSLSSTRDEFLKVVGTMRDSEENR